MAGAYKRASRRPEAAFRVFVSSTYTDMVPYRDAVRDAINKADCLSYGMERFGAAAVPPLQRCYEELEQSQMYVVVLGMRYGSVDKETGKSYTQLEYERARKLNIPILAFLVDEEQATFRVRDVDLGEGAERLRAFKDSIMNQKEVTVAFYSNPDTLAETVYRSLLGEIKRRGGTSPAAGSPEEDAYLAGCQVFDRFVKLPELYKNREVVLRVRMDGNYGAWKLRDAIYEGFGFVPGTALYLNDLYVLGKDPIDVDLDEWRLDCFAEGDAREWLIQNDVTTGTVFEGRFRTVYQLVRKAGSVASMLEPEDAKIARLVLLEGLRVIRHGAQVMPADGQGSKGDDSDGSGWSVEEPEGWG